ncbi:hypothetical protein KR038_007681 [Drosophila bunnanda]|nr:hypothetical protein KR038_007681 [Drosophila bunnanda]
MLYSMRKKRKLFRIMRKWHCKRTIRPRCIFYMSCPELDAITGPPRRDPGVIVVHPLHALQLINMGLQRATETEDRKSKRKLKAHRQHVQTILNMLQIHYKMSQLSIQDEGEGNPMCGSIPRI